MTVLKRKELFKFRHTSGMLMILFFLTGWNMLFFLWGIFRGRKMNHSDSTKKVCIPSLNVMPAEEKSSTVVLTVPEIHCLAKCKDEETMGRHRSCNALVPSTSTDQHPTTGCRNIDVNDQTHLDLQVNTEKLDGRIESKWLPTTTTLLCQETISTDSSSVMLLSLNM